MKYPTKVEQDWKATEADYAAARQRGLQQIYRAYPMIPRSTANDTGIEEICVMFLGASVAPDLPTFRSAVEAAPSILKGQHRIYIESVEVQKAKVIDEIEELLSNWHPHDLKTELTKLRFQSLEQVQARKVQIIEERRLRKMNVSAIKHELQAGRPGPKAQILPVEITKETIHAMPSGQIRELIRKYGASTVNNRLFGRS
jgi:hypothetical protein